MVRIFGSLAALTLALWVVAPSSAFANREIQCESIGFGYWPCYIGSGYAEATVSKQLSDTACVLGQTYGIDGSSLWVSGGCRGVFSISRVTRQDVVERVVCESMSYLPAECKVGQFVGVEFEQELSSLQCNRGVSWDYEPSEGVIWVRAGCRAAFNVFK